MDHKISNYVSLGWFQSLQAKDWATPQGHVHLCPPCHNKGLLHISNYSYLVSTESQYDVQDVLVKFCSRV